MSMLSTSAAVSIRGDDRVEVHVDRLNESVELTVGDRRSSVIIDMSREILEQIVRIGQDVLPQLDGSDEPYRPTGETASVK